ncbi:hypothetical protein P4O66_010336 [Electrophorus voltai]|uniref:Uncharacterized protein n=1 Tax=Electrophorus voltai TaxID=2609070 RepID=A0AAD9DV68_9TELE|nr:hypothetical protein P4O66_010336 [Electrophorus voltai]
MKCQALLLTLLMVCSLCVVGYIHNQKKEEAQLSKLISFQNVKHRVTKDVMQEYQTHLIESSSLLDKIKKQIQDLAGEVRGAQDVAEGTKNEVDMCNSDLKRIADEAVATEADKTHVKSEFEKKKASFQEQLANLKKEMEQLSKVCDYIKKTSDEAK